jgi:hypothetical protein
MLTNLTLAPQQGTVAVGETKQYTAEATFDTGAVVDYTESVVWQSNTAGVATVSNDLGEIGQVTGRAEGTANITATDPRSGTVAEVNVTVTEGSADCTPGDLCCIELCIEGDLSEGLREICLDEFDGCIGLGGDPAMCEAAAEETCTL